IAANLAKRLGAAYLDSGAMYRALTLEAMDKGVDLTDADALLGLMRSVRIDPDGHDPDNFRIGIDGRDVSDAIRANRVSTNAHYAAQNPPIRELMVARQRDYAAEVGNVVTEGRDQGTVAFVNADLKIYLDARAETRARRRQLQLEEAGEYVSFRQLLEEMNERDRRDKTRDVSPLKCPEDAVLLDTSEMTVDEVDERLHELVLSRKSDSGQGAKAE
ncbi:MAG: (d)CMP kinase, partial [Phycisphaerae bacterium]|nr:(d)CMP kinase [Phycisphaerae bacterium]